MPCSSTTSGSNVPSAPREDPHGDVGDADQHQHEREEWAEPGGMTALAPSEASV